MAGVLSCGAELPRSAIEAEVAAYFDQRGIEPDSIACPGALARERGQSLVCDVGIDGQAVPVVVEVGDEGGMLALSPRHATLVTARLEPEIAQALEDQGYAVEQVCCEGQVWVATPKSEGRCEITDREGRRYAWRGVFSGEGSRHRAHVVPLDVGPGGAR